MLVPTPIAARVSRARKDRAATAIAVATAAGVRWRWRGAELVWHGLEQLPPPDRQLLEELRPEIERRLADPAEADPEQVLEELGIDAELITDPARAAALIADLPAVVGADTETVARPGHTPAPAWLAITQDGRRAARQPKPKDRTALDPRTACIRLLQIYDPKRHTSFLFEFQLLAEHGLLPRLLDRQLVMHNALFDLQMLLAAGVEPPNVVDTTQLAALALGPGEHSHGDGEPQRISLKHVAREVLELDLSKDLQRSDWSAPTLTDAQLSYAAADPCVAYRAARGMRAQLSEREMVAFRLANAAIPVITRMAMRGLPFDPAVQAETIRQWERDYAAERQRFLEQTGLEVPVGPPAIRAWLEQRLSSDALAGWPRTTTGQLKTGADEVKRLAQDHPEVLPLIEVQKREKRLSTFGAALLKQVSPVTGRLHGDYSLPTITGRLVCQRPNLQQLPGDARAAVCAGEGKLLLAADYGQVELRILAELAGEAVMRAAFAAGQDIHTRTAARFIPEIVSWDKDDPRIKLPRRKAKAVNYGLPYGMGAATLRRKSWKDYELDMTFDEVVLLRDAWFDTYPAIKPYQQEQYSYRFDAVWSVAGRPRRACWMPDTEDELWYTYCCNFGVQASASDLLLDAMARVDRELPGTLITSVHDELLLEVDEDSADAAAKVLQEQMLDAFVHWFPDAPTTGVVEVKTVNNWSEAK